MLLMAAGGEVEVPEAGWSRGDWVVAHGLQASTIGLHTLLPPPLPLSLALPRRLTMGCHVDWLIVDVIGQ